MGYFATRTSGAGGAKLAGAGTVGLAEAAREMTGLQKAAAGGHFDDGECREARIAEKTLGAVEAYSHQLVAERAAGLREKVVQVALGDPVGVRYCARSQPGLVAAIADAAADTVENPLAAPLYMHIRSGGEREKCGELLCHDTLRKGKRFFAVGVGNVVSSA